MFGQYKLPCQEQYYRTRASDCTRELVLVNGRSIRVKEEEGVFLKNASFWSELTKVQAKQKQLQKILVTDQALTHHKKQEQNANCLERRHILSTLFGTRHFGEVAR